MRRWGVKGLEVVCVCALEECSLTATVSSLPLQTLAVGEGDDVSI